MDNKISFSKKENDLLSKVITERLSGKPLSRIFGTKEFFSMDFVINKYVLDPRPDSEILVEEALGCIKENNFKFILEFGVGSGCIIGGILKNSEEVYALGVDISEKAISTAKVNLLKNNISNFDLLVGDWGSCINKKFDLIVSNPPYIKSNDIKNLANEVKEHDPLLSLDGGYDGLQCYRAIAGQSSSGMSFRSVGSISAACCIPEASGGRFRSPTRTVPPDEGLRHALTDVGAATRAAAPIVLGAT